MSSRETQETLEQFGSCWEGLEDPRTSNATLYDFHEMLIIALCCVLCGGQGPTDMALFAELKEPFLRGFLSLKHGVPKHDAFSRLFRALDPDQFRDAFQQFMAQFSEQVQGVVAVDGKSNEITAVPKLLKMLTLKGTIVTADALNCQRTIAAQIVEQEGDYALALKGNQGTLHEDVVLLVDDPETKSATAQPVVDADHGRIETRTASVSTEIDWLQKQHQWPGLKAVGKVVRMRETAEKTTTETAYYLLSSALTPERFNEVARQHWGVENSLHWRLDVVMNEDQDRTRMGHGPENLAILRHMAINAMQKEGSKGSLRGKFKRASWNENYLTRLLTLF
jgi:predicted transposase YbfD/YdcC